MRKQFAILISTILSFFLIAPVGAVEVTGNLSPVYGYTTETNGKSHVASWGTCDGDVMTIHVAIKRKKANWTAPISAGTGNCEFSYPNIGILDNGRVFVFWFTGSEIKVATTTKVTSNKFKSSTALPKSNDITFEHSNWTVAHKNQFTYISAVTEAGKLNVYSWDLSGSKWKRTLIADLLPQDVYGECDLSAIDLCYPGVDGMSLGLNEKGQVALVAGVSLGIRNEDIVTTTYGMAVFERNTFSGKWKNSGLLDTYQGDNVSQSNFWPNSVAVSPKGKIAVSFIRQFNDVPRNISFMTSKGFGKSFQTEDIELLADQYSSDNAYVAYKGETAYATFASMATPESFPNIYFGKLGRLQEAERVAENQYPTGFGYIGGKFRILYIGQDQSSYGFNLFTKEGSNWAPSEIVEETREYRGLFSWSQHGYVSHGKFLMISIGYFDDGQSSNAGEGFYFSIL